MIKRSHATWALPFLALLFVLPAPADAQLTVGVTAGPTFATLEGDDVNDADTRTGFAGGAFVAVPVGEVISITPGLYYVQKGAAFEEGTTEGSMDLSYLEVPLLLQVGVIGQDRPLGGSVFLGPSFAFEVGCEISADDGDVSGSVDCGDEGRKSFDIGAMFGAGINFGLSETMAVVVNGGLDLGLSSIDDTEDDADIKNSMYFLTAGLSFVLGG